MASFKAARFFFCGANQIWGGATELATLNKGVKFFSDRGYVLRDLPKELDGLTFTRRPGGKASNLEIMAPAGAKL